MTVDLGLLILRVIVGLLFVGHGAQKLFGWFGGHGIKGTGAWFESIGIRPGTFWATVAGLVEFFGGLLFALGLLGPVGSLAILASMLTAIVKVHWPKVWVAEGGLEYPLVNGAVAFVVGLLGPGAYSLDAYLGIRLPMPETFWVGLVVVLLGVIVASVSGALFAPTATRRTA